MSGFCGTANIHYLLVGNSAELRFGPILRNLTLPGKTETGQEVDVRFEDQQEVEVLRKDVSLDFLWMTRSESKFSTIKEDVLCYNHLSGAQVLEDKCNLSLIHSQTVGDDGTRALEAYVVKGKAGYLTWCKNHAESLESGKMWIVKDSKANGAAGLWIFRYSNLETVATELQPNVEYLIQEYIENPMLWKNRKFHFRCYAVLKGNLQLFLYKRAFLHAANKRYDFGKGSDIPDDVHITNCCANKGDVDFAGEIVVDLEKDYPDLFPKMLKVFHKLTEDLQPFMKYQRSEHHFEYIGFDLMADTLGNVWLIEANCPPGMDTATGLSHAEMFQDEVARALLQAFVANPSIERHQLGKAQDPSTLGWISVNQGVDTFQSTLVKGDLALNALSFAMFKSRLKKR